VTATVQAGLKMRRSRVRARKLYLGDTEQTILFDIARLAKGRPILLVCDNVHWWDEQSLQFLGRLREERMAAAFPYLADLRVLAVQTPTRRPSTHSCGLEPRGTSICHEPRARGSIKSSSSSGRLQMTWPTWPTPSTI
jgi:hypothetical protein